MSDMDNRILGITKYVATPSTRISILGLLLVSMLVGYILSLMGPIEGVSSPIYGVWAELLILGVMSILSGGLTKLLVHLSQGNPIKLRHSMLLAFFSMLLVSGTILIVAAIYSSIGGPISFSEDFIITPEDFMINALLFGCSIIFAIRTMFIWAMSNISFLKSSLIAATQPLIIIGAFLTLTILMWTRSVSAWSMSFLRAYCPS